MPAVKDQPRIVPRIVLSNPTRLELSGARLGTPARSWVQIAKTGSFVSNRYGAFSITKDDLVQMLHNYQRVTPQAPTELPVDYDHLSMDPKKPGDGIAAGWFKALELREDGDALWGEIEWTPEGARKIAHHEYRFVSPSFVKDHVHKNGEKIGTTLLAAAITNHPFLEGMEALTLYNDSAMGDLALLESTTVRDRQEARMTSTTAKHLADSGQHVTFVADAALTPELNDEERAATYAVKEAIGQGDDQFVRLTSVEGDELGWFRVTVLAPADPPDKAATPPAPLTEDVADPRAVSMAADHASAQLLTLAQTLMTDRGLSLSAATKEAGRLHPDWVRARADRAEEEMPATPEDAAPVLSLSQSERTSTSFVQLVDTVQRERALPSLKAAMALAADLRPDLAARYSAGA